MAFKSICLETQPYHACETMTYGVSTNRRWDSSGCSHRFSQSIFIRNKALRRTKIGWQSPFFTRTHFYHGLLVFRYSDPTCYDQGTKTTPESNTS